MTRKSRETPLLRVKDQWHPKSKPSPFRRTITSERQFQPELNTNEEHDLKWLDPMKGAKVKTVDKRAR
jgi:hypothetical protein